MGSRAPFHSQTQNSAETSTPENSGASTTGDVHGNVTPPCARQSTYQHRRRPRPLAWNENGTHPDEGQDDQGAPGEREHRAQIVDDGELPGEVALDGLEREDEGDEDEGAEGDGKGDPEAPPPAHFLCEDAAEEGPDGEAERDDDADDALVFPAVVVVDAW